MTADATDSSELAQNSATLPSQVPTIPIQRDANLRYVAASFDNVVQLLGGVFLIKSLPPSWAVLQVPLIPIIYFGYFLLFEGLWATSPGKLLTGLVVVQYDGRKCTWRQAWQRTLLRLVEVNPLFLGALPAALMIIRTRYHQRLGDKWARTLFVPRSVYKAAKRERLGA